MATDAPPRERIPITFERGVNEGLAESMLPDGASSRISNWEPSPTGEMRVRKAWSKGSTTSAPSTRKGVGIGYFSRVTIPGLVQVSNLLSVIDSGSSGNGTLEFPTPTQEGNLIVVIAGISDADGTGATAGLTNFTTLLTTADTSNRPRLSILYRANAPTTSSITTNNLISGGDSTGVGWTQAFEFNGITLTSPADVSTSNGGNSATMNTGTTGTTAQAIELAVGVYATDAQDATFSGVTTGYALAGNTVNITATAGADISTEVRWKSTNATGTQNLQATASAGGDFAGAIAVFKGWYTGSGSTQSLTQFLVANNETTAYGFYALDRNNLSAGTWEAETTISVTDSSQHVSMAPGLGRTWITNPQFTRMWNYDGVSISPVLNGPPGRCVATHKNRVWVGGTNSHPGRLWFSDIGNGASWPVLNFIDVAAEDGEPIEDITPLGEVLVIGKRTGLWFLSGSGLDTFDLQRLTTGGLAPGRTLAPTPYGVVCVGRNFIWIADLNGAVEKYSLPVSSSYMYTSGFITTSYVDDQVYINDPVSRKQFVFNFQTGTWREENLADRSSTESPAVLGNHDQTQVYAPINGSVGSLLNYRDFPNGVARFKDFDTLTETFVLQSREIFPVGPEEACTPIKLYLRIRQHGGNSSSAGITVTPQYRGLLGERTSGPAIDVPARAGETVFRERLDLGHMKGVGGIRFDFAQTLGSTDDSCMDIEEVTLEYIVERIR